MQEKLPGKRKGIFFYTLLWFLAISLGGCFSVNDKLGKYFASLQMAYMSEDDPELVKSSLPLNMKIIEALILELPDEHFLLSAASSIFVSYTYGFVLNKAEMMDPNKHEERSKLFKRSLKLLNRANSYAMRALKVKYPTLKVQIENKTNKEIAAAIESFPFIKEDIQTLYFAAASFAGTILSSRGDTHYVVKLPIVSALLRKSLSLDPDWNDGALHTAMISLVLQDLTKTKDQKKEQAIVYFHRAVMASNGNDCNPYVSLAENLSKQEQDKKAFLELINKALKVDTDKHFKNRLSNVLCQRKALWLRKNIDALFI